MLMMSMMRKMNIHILPALQSVRRNVCIYIYVYICIYMYIYVYICIYTYVHIRFCNLLPIHTHQKKQHTHTHTLCCMYIITIGITISIFCKKSSNLIISNPTLRPYPSFPSPNIQATNVKTKSLTSRL